MKTSMKCLLGLSVMVLLAVSGGVFAATGVAGVDNGIAMVMDADTIGLANGTLFNTWTDQSGLGNDMVSFDTYGWGRVDGVPTYCAPKYLTNQINGHAAVSLMRDPGYCDLMRTATNPIAGTTMTAFVVFNDHQTTWNSDYPDYRQSGIVSFGNMADPSHAVEVMTYGGYATPADPYYYSAADTFQVYGPSVLSRGSFIPYQQYGVMTLEFNGAFSFAKLNGDVKATGDATGRYWAGDMLIGGRSNNSSGQFSALDVASIVVYNRALSSDEENAVGSYLGSKYALTTSYVSVPEPSSLLALGMAGFGLLLRRRRH